jgi:CRP-like cAMP-binding protein
MDTPNNVDANSILPILKKIPLFATLDENLHREVIKRIILMYYPDNYQVFKEGELGDALYIVKKGKIKIYHEPKEGSILPVDVADLNDGEFFGEMSLISDIPHNASARSVSESEVFILSKDQFHELLNNNAALAHQVSETVVHRANDNDQQV